MTRIRRSTLLLLSLAFAISAGAQTSAPHAADPAAGANHAAELAESGQCKQALPALQRSVGHLTDKGLQKRVGTDGVRCATLLQRNDALLEFLRVLNQQFPNDPEVLYISAHAFSDLANRATQQLAVTAPDSVPALEMDADASEMQGKWDQAEADYQKILSREPRYPGIHFRMARLLLSRPNPPAGFQDEARKLLQTELEIDPSNAGAEYVLGELTRQAGDLNDATHHFTRATQLDPNFADAFLGLGVTLLAQKDYNAAVAPLEAAARLRPENPAAHYNLATAYARTGRRADAERELALQQQAADRLNKNAPPQP